MGERHSGQYQQLHFPSFPLPRLLLLLLCLSTAANAFFGGGSCCCDCCCDCCCGCCSPLLLVPCCSSGCNSFGLYGGAIFGKRRKRELYARTGARSADFLNDHRCAERFWLKLVERKKKQEGRVKSTEKVHDRVPAAKRPIRERRSLGLHRLELAVL